MRCGAAHGAQRATCRSYSREGGKTATTGVPIVPATCIAPESGATSAAARADRVLPGFEFVEVFDLQASRVRNRFRIRSLAASAQETQLRRLGRAAHERDHVAARNAQPLPLLGDLHRDVVLRLDLAFEHERTELRRVARWGGAAGEGGAQREEHLAFVRRARVESGAAIDGVGEKRARPQRLERLAPRVGESYAYRRANRARETIAAWILGRHEDVRVPAGSQTRSECIYRLEVFLRARAQLEAGDLDVANGACGEDAGVGAPEYDVYRNLSRSQKGQKRRERQGIADRVEADDEHRR